MFVARIDFVVKKLLLAFLAVSATSCVGSTLLISADWSHHSSLISTDWTHHSWVIRGHHSMKVIIIVWSRHLSKAHDHWLKTSFFNKLQVFSIASLITKIPNIRDDIITDVRVFCNFLETSRQFFSLKTWIFQHLCEPFFIGRNSK